MSRETKKDLAERLIYASRVAEAANERFDDLASEALGINRTDARCLNMVENEGGSLTAGRIAELSGLTTAAVTTVLDRLERKGYARRVRDERDRRRVLVELTPEFRERAGAIWGPLGQEAARAFERFTAEQLRGVIAYYELSRELNERHAGRIRELRFD